MKILNYIKALFSKKKQPSDLPSTKMQFVIEVDNKADKQLKHVKKALGGLLTKNIKELRDYAMKYKWVEIDFQPKSYMISFAKNNMRLNVYYTTLTVGTCLSHPTKGKTQLFRKFLSMEELEKIFINPRTHTDKGYYKK